MKLLQIGCGNMGRALLDGWLAAGVVTPADVTVVDPFAAAPEGVRLERALPASGGYDVVVLAVKPQQLDTLAHDLGPATRDAIVLSVLAGAPVARLAALLPEARPVRIMGNLAAAFGMSPIALYAAPGVLSEADRTVVGRLAGALGPTEWLACEELLHAVTALAGSGPGFVYRLLAAFARGGAGLGLDSEAAASMSLAMVRGAAELAARSGEDFATLAARVASPGGTTEAGLAVLEAGDALDALIAATLRAAAERSAELAG